MSYTTDSGRQQIIGDTAAAVTALDTALAHLGEAYDHLDEQSADRMETTAFRPLQAAYSMLRRTRSEFAQRYELDVPGTEPVPALMPEDARTALERAADAIESTDEILIELQDSLLPVEVGDRELRTGLAETRSLLAPLPAACDALIRGFGR